LGETHEKLAAAEAAFQQDIGNLKKQLEVSRETAESTQEKLKNSEDNLESLKKQLEEFQKESSKKESKRQDMENAFAAAKQNIEGLKKQLEATQREVDDLQRIKRQEAEERERQERIRLQREKQERENQEKVALWCAGMDITIQHVKDLQVHLIYRDLLKILEDMKTYYTNVECDRISKVIELERTSKPFLTPDINGRSEIDLVKQLIDSFAQSLTLVRQKGSYNGGSYWVLTHEYDSLGVKGVLAFLKKILVKKMEKYEELQGAPHPRLDEVNKL